MNLQYLDQKYNQRSAKLDASIYGISFIGSLLILYMSIGILLRGIDGYKYFIVGFIISTVWFCLVLCLVGLEKNVIKEHVFHEGRILLTYYFFGNRVFFRYDELSSLNEISRSLANKYFICMNQTLPFYEIICKNGKRYRISPFMERQEELISKLQSIIADNQKSKN